MSKTKGGGSTRNGRDSNAQRLGVKVFDGTQITAGTIIVRQRGTKVHPGLNVGLGKDDTLFSMVDGSVKFGSRKGRKIVDVLTTDGSSSPLPEQQVEFSLSDIDALGQTRLVPAQVSQRLAARKPVGHPRHIGHRMVQGLG